MIFAVRQLQEKCIKQHQDLHLLFIDLTKAFDFVNCNCLWIILSPIPRSNISLTETSYLLIIALLTHSDSELQLQPLELLGSQ
jgi:hypothetical protein